MGLCPSGMKSRKRRACPHPSGMRNHAGRTSSVRYEVTRKESLHSSIRYEESSRQDSVRYEVMQGELLHVCLLRGIKHAGLRPSGIKLCETKACPRPSGTRNHAGGTSSIAYEVAQNEGLSTSFRTRNQARGTSYIRFDVARNESMSSSSWYEE